MPIRPPTHRAAGQARRTALLEAAVEVIAEHGVTGTTHRAVAARAGMPLSTTSYFFASIDELIAAAMAMTATRLVDKIDAARVHIIDQDLDVDEMVDRFANLLLGISPTELAAEFEIYLQCRHQPALRELAQQMIAGFERSAEAALLAVGAADPSVAARAVVALVDGFALQRFAWPRGADDRTAMAQGLRTLIRAYLP